MERQSIYGMTPAEYGAKLKKHLAFDLVLAGITLFLNILLVFLRNDQTHVWFMIFNMLSDIVCGMYLVYDLSVNFRPRWRLWKLSERRAETISGEITEIESQTTRFADLDCYCVRLGRRRTFLPAGTLRLEVGQQVELTLSGNVILEVAR